MRLASNSAERQRGELTELRTLRSDARGEIGS